MPFNFLPSELCIRFNHIRPLFWRRVGLSRSSMRELETRRGALEMTLVDARWDGEGILQAVDVRS